jgi:transcriptional regulator of aromatic amino acid metabolism
LIVSFGHEKGFYRSYGTVKVIFEVDYLSWWSRRITADKLDCFARKWRVRGVFTSSKTNVRIVAATNVNLWRNRKGKFREDLSD